VKICNEIVINQRNNEKCNQCNGVAANVKEIMSTTGNENVEEIMYRNM